jgi:hypothetical protein
MPARVTQRLVSVCFIEARVMRTGTTMCSMPTRVAGWMRESARLARENDGLAPESLGCAKIDKRIPYPIRGLAWSGEKSTSRDGPSGHQAGLKGEGRRSGTAPDVLADFGVGGDNQGIGERRERWRFPVPHGWFDSLIFWDSQEGWKTGSKTPSNSSRLPIFLFKSPDSFEVLRVEQRHRWWSRWQQLSNKAATSSLQSKLASVDTPYRCCSSRSALPCCSRPRRASHPTTSFVRATSRSRRTRTQPMRRPPNGFRLLRS